MAQFNGTVEQLEQSVNTTESIADYVVESGETITNNEENLPITWHFVKWKSGKVMLWCVYTIRSTADSSGVYSRHLNLPFEMKDRDNYVVFASVFNKGTGTVYPNVMPYFSKTKTSFYLGSDTPDLKFNRLVIGQLADDT